MVRASSSLPANQYYIELHRQQNKVTVFNDIMEKYHLNGHVSETTINGVVQFLYRSNNQPVTTDVLIAVLNDLMAYRFLWSGDMTNDVELVHEFTWISDINGDLQQFGAPVRLVPVHHREQNEFEVMAVKISS